MKKFNIILFVILFVSNWMIIYSQGNPKIINETEMKLTKEMINQIISVSNRNGIKDIEKIIIGVEVHPIGIDGNQITVYSKDKIIDGYKIEKRRLSLKSNYFGNQFNITHKPFQLTVYPIKINNYWRMIIKSDTIEVIQHPSTNYQEVKEIVYLIHDGLYKYQNNMLKKELKNEVTKISKVKKENDKYYIIFSDKYGGDIYTCNKKNNFLVIVGRSGYIF